MANYIQDIKVDILKQTRTLSQRGFGKALIVGETAPFYSKIFGTGTSGIKVTAKVRGTVYYSVVIADPEGINQSLSVARTGSGTEGSPYIITINLATDGSGDITSTAAEVKAAAEASADVAHPTTGIVSVDLISDDGSGVMAVSVSTGLTGVRYNEFTELTEAAAVYPTDSVEYLMVSAFFRQNPRPPLVAVYSRDSGADIATTLTALFENHNDWWALLINNRTKTHLNAAGTWCLTNKKFFIGCTDDLTALDDRDNEREAYVIHDQPTTYPDAAWAGLMLPKTPGSATWKWKSPAGLTTTQLPVVEFSSTNLKTIRSNNGNTFTQFGNFVHSNEGVTTSGEFIDVIHSQDWVQSRIEESIMAILLENDKIAMDNAGIAQIEGVIRSVMSEAALAGVIARATTDFEKNNNSDDGEFQYKVSVPLREEISVANRAARILPDVNFEYYLAGAIHEARVTGRILV